MGIAIIKVSLGILSEVLFSDQVKVIRVLAQDSNDAGLGVVGFVIEGSQLSETKEGKLIEEVQATFKVKGIKKKYEHVEINFTPVGK